MKRSARKTRSSRKALERRLTELERHLMQELRERLDNIQNMSRSHPSELLDIVSEGEIDFMSAVSAESGSATIAEIQRALEKLREDDYGTCDACGRPIAKRRLEAQPFAVLCISCKEKKERTGYAGATTVAPCDESFGVSLTNDDASDFGVVGSDLLRDIEEIEVNEMF